MSAETKVISFRISQSFHLRILEECAVNSCTKSDWIVLRIHLADRAATTLGNLRAEILECGCPCAVGEKIRKLKEDQGDE